MLRVKGEKRERKRKENDEKQQQQRQQKIKMSALNAVSQAESADNFSGIISSSYMADAKSFASFNAIMNDSERCFHLCMEMIMMMMVRII
jgi:hypothetical protein